MHKVLIGIQARSTSTRLPGKSLETVAGRTVTDWVVTHVKSAARYLTEHQGFGVTARAMLLVPKGDALVKAMASQIEVFEGDEQDVLSRYARAAENHGSDWICRVTGDCPVISSYIVSKLVQLAVVQGYDYVSNVDERFRTTLDGHDCEVFSRSLLEDVDRRANLPADREHVTTMMRRDPPPWAKSGFVCGHIDLSWLKLSVDTPEDLDHVRRFFEAAREKYKRACNAFGKDQVHRL